MRLEAATPPGPRTVNLANPRPLGQTLRSEDGRRNLQPVLEIAARRAAEATAELDAAGASLVIDDAYRENWAFRMARFEEEKQEFESWGANSSRRRQGGKGGKRG